MTLGPSRDRTCWWHSWEWGPAPPAPLCSPGSALVLHYSSHHLIPAALNFRAAEMLSNPRASNSLHKWPFALKGLVLSGRGVVYWYLLNNFNPWWSVTSLGQSHWDKGHYLPGPDTDIQMEFQIWFLLGRAKQILSHLICDILPPLPQLWMSTETNFQYLE